MKKSLYIICSILLIALVFGALTLLIEPLSHFGSEYRHLAKTYAYTITNKEFLKYEDGFIYTTDGCKYADEEENFPEYVVLSDPNYPEYIERIEVYTSNMTGEAFYAVIHHTNVDHPRDFHIFSIFGSYVEGQYVNKDEETDNFLTFYTVLVPLLTFTATAASVFLTKSAKKRTVFVSLYFVALPIAALSHIEKLTASGAELMCGLSAILTVATFLYGAIAYYTSRRILIPSLILASAHTVFGAVGIAEIIREPLDFIIQNCSSVSWAVLGALAVLLIHQLSLATFKYTPLKCAPIEKFFGHFSDLNFTFSEFAVKFSIPLLLIFLEIALLHKASLLARGDWGGLVYAFPALFIIPPLFGILSTVCTSRIILPHVIFAAVYFHAGMLSANPGFNTSSDDLIWQACVDIIRIMLHSLIPALIVYFIRKKRKAAEELPTADQAHQTNN